MRVNGSTNSVDFWVESDQLQDIWIKSLSIIISDNGASLDSFGALSALTNGVKIAHITTDEGEAIIADDLKTNLDVVRLCLGTPPIGSGTDAFRADTSGSGADSYIPTLDFEKTFGIQWGLRFRAGRTDKLVFTIRDNVSGVDRFDVIAYGLKF